MLANVSVGSAGNGLVLPVARLLVSLMFSSVALSAWAAESPEKMEAGRLAEQAQTYRVSDKDIHNLPIADGPQDRLNSWIAAQAASRSIIQDNYTAHTGLSVLGPTGPGIRVASTTYEYQHNDAAPHQIATNGSGKYIHFAWTHSYVIPASLAEMTRFVNVNTYNSGTASFIDGSDGTTISGAGGDPALARAGYVTVDVADNDTAWVAFHQRDVPEQPSGDYSSWVLQRTAPSSPVFNEYLMPGSKGWTWNADDDIIWPHVTVDQISAGPDVIHVVAHTSNSNDNIVYWRWKSTDAPQWKGPYTIDSNQALSYNIAADRGSANAALITLNDNVTGSNPNGLLQVVYRASTSNGDDWGPVSTTGLGDGNRTFITSYNTDPGPQAWQEVVGDYDNAGNLHAVWVEQRFANTTEHSSMKHWDKASNVISTISLAYYDAKGANGGRDCNSAFPTIGFGDGSTTCGTGTNLNYIYMIFVQFGGTSVAQQNDFSAAGYMNGDIYLSTSNNGGLVWAPAVNLTNSMSPGCNPATGDSCASENWPSIARTVDDTLHIMYINDRDAGDAVFGQGVWTFNPVMYYRIPGGTNVQPVCPLIAPNFGAELSNAKGSECEYNTPPNTSLNETLTLSNVGNATMTGTVSRVYISPPSGTWLTVTGQGAYSILAGGANLTYPVTMNAAGLTEGLRTAKIRVTHNDPTKTSPFDIPVDFFVFNTFFCPKYVVLHTKWLEMEVSNIERVAVGPNRNSGSVRGLYRPQRFGQADSGNNSIYDGSLIIAKPPSPDTFVYRYIYGEGKGQPGFRALSNLTVDTSRYGTGSGTAYARANQTTVDSTIGVDVEYVFPQHTDSSEFVLIKYRIFNRTASPITGLIVGETVDFDIAPSTLNAKYQIGKENKSGFNTSMNLLYQQGADSGATTYAQKYLGGMTAIQSTAAPRAWIAPNDPWLFGRPGGGFSEGYLYQNLVKSDFEIIPPGTTPPSGGVDQHSVIAFEKNVTLNPTTVKRYVLGLVSSTAGPSTTDLISQTRKAWKFAFGWQEIVDLDTLPMSTPASYPYWALGSHEGGPTSGCCGCVVTKASGSSLLTVTPSADPCTGTINFAGTATPGTYTATFRVKTLVCGSAQYTDDQVVTIVVPPGPCSCPHQGDIDADGCIDVFDFIAVTGIAFSDGTDPQDAGCPTTRGDVDRVNSPGVTDVFDVITEIDIAFSDATAADPCAPVQSRSSQDTAAIAAQATFLLSSKTKSESTEHPAPQEVSGGTLANSVTVETKGVDAGTTTTIGIAISNDITIRHFVCPLQLRTLSGGAYITALTPQRTPGGRLSSILDMSALNTYPTPSGTCKDFQTGGFSAHGAPDYVSPDGVLFSVGKFVPYDAALSPGADPAEGSLRLSVTVNNSAGQFEVDTTCTDPCNHLIFVQDVTNAPILPAFTKGVITVGPVVNHPPVARDTSWTTSQNASNNVAYLPASDPDAGQVLTYAILSGPAHGATSGFNPATGALTYTPVAGYTGPDSLKFAVCDNGSPAMCDTGTVRITVRPNATPVARDTSWTAIPDTPNNMAYLPASDPDAGQVLAYAILSGPAHGLTSGFNSATGAYTYTPATGYTGPDSLKFKVCDNGTPSMCDTGTVRIMVFILSSDSNSVVVESKTVAAGATEVTIGVFLTNGVAIQNYVIPLELRSISGGAFITRMKRSYPAGTRLDGKLTLVSIINFYDGSSVGRNCKGGQPGGYAAYSNNVQDVFFPVVASPVAVLFARLGGGYLGAGTDGSNPQMLLTVDIHNSFGTFEIDTTCTDPANHVSFRNMSGITIAPAFTKGVITVPNPTIVANLADSGVGSFRAAINYANSHPGSDTIRFDVARTIQLRTPLTPLSDESSGTLVQGFTAPGASSPATPTVILDGSQSIAGAALAIQSPNNRIEGLTFRDFNGAGIAMTGDSSFSNTITGCLFYANNRPGIDLGNDGVTVNDSVLDADAGPNTLLNYPVFDSVLEIAPDTFAVFGKSAPKSHVELFLATEAGSPIYVPEGIKHGPAYLLMESTTADADGAFSLSPIAKPEWSEVTATATDTLGNTSEFAENKVLTPDPLRITGYSEPVPPVHGLRSYPSGSPAMQIVVFSPPNSSDKVDSIGPSFNTFGSRASYDSLTDYNSGGLPDSRVKIIAPDTGEYRIKYVLIGDAGNYLTGIGIDGHAEVKRQVAFAAMGQVIDTTYQLAPPTRGDLNGDGVIDVFDVVASIDMIFSGAPMPDPTELIDVNCDQVPDIFDIVHLIDYAFSGGAEPCR